jgi:uncharacterized protein with GYD domain
MATYIVLINYTDQGIRDIGGVPGRIDSARELFGKHGAELSAVYLTMGGYDMVAIIEAPSDEVMAKLTLTIGSAGNIRTTTLKAFGEDDLRKIVGSLG